MNCPWSFYCWFFKPPALRAATVAEITQLVGAGHWQQARAEIAQELHRTNLSFQARQDLLFQSDRMERMRLDFDKTREQVFREARAIAPSISEEQFADWEKAGAVEFLDIDGTRRYFSQGGGQFVSSSIRKPGRSKRNYIPTPSRNRFTAWQTFGASSRIMTKPASGSTRRGPGA